jgi:adenylate cyclase
VLAQADEAIGLASDNVRAYFVKANYLNNSRRFREALGVAEAGLAINPNFAPLLAMRAIAENSFGRYEQVMADAQQAMRLSPRDPYVGLFRFLMGVAELGLGHYDAASEQYHQAIDLGYRPYFVYADLAATYANAGKMDEAKAASPKPAASTPNSQSNG